jgi:PPOX class probable F420-dependent enzyme
MRTMTDEEWRAFLGEGSRTGKLAVTRADGAPHVTPVWFVLDSHDGVDEIVFNTGAGSLKGRALARDPRFCLCVDREVAPYDFVVARGTVRLIDDLDEMRVWATRIAARYMGQERADSFGRRNAVAGELLVRGRIEHVTAQESVAE